MVWLSLAGGTPLVAQDASQAALDDALFWNSLDEPDHFIIMRHALAPGTGDPAGFDVAECSTQRNLDASGRRQADETGALLKQHGMTKAHVFSSAWCRCLETARLLGLGEVDIQPTLNSFFQNFERSQAQTDALRSWLSETIADSDAPLILVTHQVNITALTGVYPASGEMVLAKLGVQGEIEVVATVEVDPR